MDLYGELQLKWSVGYNGSQLNYIDENTLVYSCGNTLSFVRDNGEHVLSIPSEGKGVGPIAVCTKASLVAYAEVTLHPRVFIISYPACKVECILEGGCRLEYTQLAFSSDGKKLASLSGIPDFKLSLWDCVEGCEISHVNVGSGDIQLSFNPLNWKQLCLVGPNRTTLWTLEQCDTQNLLTKVEVEVPDKFAPVGSILPPKISTRKASAKLERMDTKLEHGVSIYTPPDMSKVLYQETYSDFMLSKQPVEFTSHCWTPQQSIYIGCVGGQLIKIESDSGTVTVLANPQMADQGSSSQLLGSKESSSEVEGNVSSGPKTGHAILSENSINVIALSRKGLFTAGKNGVICCFDPGDKLALVDSLSVDQPITSMSWSSSYSRLAVGTEQGKILSVNPRKLGDDPTLVSDHHHTQLVGIDVLTPGYEYCITCRSDGTVQAWSIKDGSLVSTFNLDTECTSLACPLSCCMAIIGTVSGHIYVISFTDPSNPHLSEKRLVHNFPVKAIKHDQRAKFMASASTEGPVFIYDSRPSTQFAILGYIDIEGELLDLSLLSCDNTTHVSVLTQLQGKQFATLLQLPQSILDQTPPELYSDATKRFSKDFVLWHQAEITEHVLSLTLAPGNCALAFLASTMQFTKMNLPPSTDKDIDWTLTPDLTFKGHELDGSKAVLSFHQKWLVSGASDGEMVLRLLENPEKFLSCAPHHYQSGGCRAIVFTTDSQNLLTIGDSENITCWKIQFSEHGSMKGSSAAEFTNRAMKSLESLHSKENDILSSMNTSQESVSGEEKTWLQLMKEEAHKAEDEQYAENKNQLRQDISELREKVLTMIATNEELPDIEKLERQEFILDTEDHQRLQAEEEQLIQEVRDEIELSNLAMMFTREQIKNECWDGMTVKGVVVKSFRSHFEVSNYPLKSRSEAKVKELERIQTLRRIEIAERKIRKEVSASLKQTLSLRVDEPLVDDDEFLSEGKEKQQQQKEEEKGDPDSLLGSHGAQFGGGSDLLLDQFELHSTIGKKHQIVLLEDCIHSIKETFNKEFDEVSRLKENEIARIKEKNVRVNKIINQLKLSDSLVQPSLDSDEQPQRLLIVDDGEVTVEKYISPEEEKRLEEVAKQEELRRIAEMGDNPRERALDMMMGGRLEANVEEDLFKDLPRPEFMSKDPAEMTEDEIRQAREFEKKEEEKLEEREKLKKSLEAELRKLQSQIDQGMEQFDDRLHKLFDLKIRTEMAVHQEELKVLHLTCSLLIEEEVTMRAKQLNQLLEEKKVTKVNLGGTISNAKRRVDEFREQYEFMAAEDRELDKSFKRDFTDCEPYVDQLYKLFRKRPKGYRLKPGPSDGNFVSDPSSQNPFAVRPSSAVGGERGQGREADDPMAELDHISNMPEGLEQEASWDRFVLYRQRKMQSERKVKTMALKFAEMNAFLQKRQAEDERLQQEIQDIFKDLNKLQEDKMVFDLNLQIQLLLKQGQVEVDMDGFVPDFSDSVLVHRRNIEDLNSQIKTLGEGKLHSMLECKDFKRGIHMLEWEHKKLQMEAEDLIEKAKDIQMLRVTKELQQRLMEENVASKDQNEIETLEKTIELNQNMHRKAFRERKKVLTKLQRDVAERHTQNVQMEKQVLEHQILVAEREMVETLAGIPPSEANREQRMHDIVTRRRLVETVKAQDHQISVLRSELERLRMRTFPALVQVD